MLNALRSELGPESFASERFAFETFGSVSATEHEVLSDPLGSPEYEIFELNDSQ